ncbi:endothelin-converting enzyme 1 [Nephila pilipes]|uniref:Endothelin-converting enzyme 1 n=1 Tax=Nephila pilipes TaxID=299642 RepID=A0A8X6NA62_NEPPI|nr:endothelin-converting enzyme 1 [Nephila pilipes]
MNGNQDRIFVPKKRNFWQRRSKMEKILLVATVLLLLLGIFLFTISMVQIHKTGMKADSGEICLTSTCVTVAANIINFMDQSADPCEDIYQYACGGWMKFNPLPTHKSEWNRHAELTEINYNILKYVLEDENFPLKSEAERKARTLYKSCMNETRIEELGLQPLIDLLNKVSSILRTNKFYHEIYRAVP